MNNEDRFVTQPIDNNNGTQTNAGNVPTIQKATIVSSSNVVNTQPTTPVVANEAPQINSVQNVPVDTNTTPQVPVDTTIPQSSVDTNTPQITTPGTTPQINSDPGMVTDEKLKKVEINYTPPSKFKIFLMIFFFVLLIGFVIFLPDITAYINKLKSGDLNYQEEKITTGKLKCNLQTSTTNLDKEYKLVFKFTDNKLNKVEFNITTRGDVSLDEETLDKLNDTCNNLKNAAKGLNGVYINCQYSDGELVETQNFELASVEKEKLDAAYTEAGGNHPEYQDGQDMDGIERNLNASGYTCKREK